MKNRQPNNADIRANEVMRVTLIGFAVNCFLTLIKYAAGVLGHSGAMIADATHSLSDIITDFAILFGFLFVRKPADEDHRYGHGKVETLITSFCGFILILAAFGILTPAISKLWEAWNGHFPPRPGAIALIAAVLSIIAWLVYIVLLWGHYHEGWRGRRVVWFNVAGAGILTLAYFGSRFIQQFAG